MDVFERVAAVTRDMAAMLVVRFCEEFRFFVAQGKTAFVGFV